MRPLRRRALLAEQAVVRSLRPDDRHRCGLGLAIGLADGIGAGALVGDLEHRPEARERCGRARPRGPGGEVEIEVEVHARACPRR